MAVNLWAEVRSLLRIRMGHRSRAEVLAWAEPLVDAYMSGFASGDYTVASVGFSPSLRESFDSAAFFQQWRQVLELVGDYDSHAVQAVQRQGAHVLVVALVFFERERKAVLRALFSPTSREMDGVWLASSRLKRGSADRP
jgi:hypothetical protein